MAVTASSASYRDSHGYYVRLALLFAVLETLAFVPTYWGPLAAGALQGGSRALHVHAVLFSVWPLLFLGQTYLAATRRMSMHRALGLAGAVSAAGMVWSGLWVTAESIDVQSALGYPQQARAFAIISFTKIVYFGACIALAVALVSRPAFHKRLMVLAMLPLAQAAVPRVLYAVFMPPDSPQRPGLGEPASMLVGLPSAAIVDLLLLALALRDRRHSGRVHPVYLVGGTAFVAIQVLRVPASSTAAWQTFAAWLATFT